MSSWYYSKDGRNIGPLSSKKIANKVLEQELELDDYVLCTKTQLWKRIREIKEIVDIVHSPVSGHVFQDINIQGLEQELGIQAMDLEQPFIYFSITEVIFWQLVTLGTFGMYWLVKQNYYLKGLVETEKTQYSRLKRFAFGPINPFLNVIKGIENHKTLNKALAPTNSYVGIFILWTILMLTALLMVFITLTSLIIPSLFAASVSFLAVIVPTQLYINHCHEKLKIPRTKRPISFYVWMVFMGGLSWLLLFFISKL